MWDATLNNSQRVISLLIGKALTLNPLMAAAGFNINEEITNSLITAGAKLNDFDANGSNICCYIWQKP